MGQSFFMTLTEAIKELYFWQFGNNDNFHSLLYRLISKADYGNRLNLSRAFPAEVLAFTLWQDSEDPDAFYAKHGLHRMSGVLEKS